MSDEEALDLHTDPMDRSCPTTSHVSRCITPDFLLDPIPSELPSANSSDLSEEEDGYLSTPLQEERRPSPPIIVISPVLEENPDAEDSSSNTSSSSRPLSPLYETSDESDCEVLEELQRSTSPEFLPRSTTPEFLPRSTSPEFLPRSMTPEFLPRSMTPEFLPRSANPEVLPRSMTPEFLPRSITPEVLPRSMTPEFLPRSMTPEVLPRSTTPEFLPRSMTPEFLPRSTTPEVLPRSANPEVLPRSMTPEFLPRSMTPEVLPRSTTPEFLPRSANPEFLPRSMTPEFLPRSTTPEDDTFEISPSEPVLRTTRFSNSLLPRPRPVSEQFVRRFAEPPSHKRHSLSHIETQPGSRQELLGSDVRRSLPENRDPCEDNVYSTLPLPPTPKNCDKSNGDRSPYNTLNESSDDKDLKSELTLFGSTSEGRVRGGSESNIYSSPSRRQNAAFYHPRHSCAFGDRMPRPSFGHEYQNQDSKLSGCQTLLNYSIDEDDYSEPTASSVDASRKMRSESSPNPVNRRKTTLEKLDFVRKSSPITDDVTAGDALDEDPPEVPAVSFCQEKFVSCDLKGQGLLRHNSTVAERRQASYQRMRRLTDPFFETKHPIAVQDRYSLLEDMQMSWGDVGETAPIPKLNNEDSSEDKKNDMLDERPPIAPDPEPEIYSELNDALVSEDEDQEEKMKLQDTLPPVSNTSDSWKSHLGATADVAQVFCEDIYIEMNDNRAASPNITRSLVSDGSQNSLISEGPFDCPPGRDSVDQVYDTLTSPEPETPAQNLDDRVRKDSKEETNSVSLEERVTSKETKASKSKRKFSGGRSKKENAKNAPTSRSMPRLSRLFSFGKSEGRSMSPTDTSQNTEKSKGTKTVVWTKADRKLSKGMIPAPERSKSGPVQQLSFEVPEDEDIHQSLLLPQPSSNSGPTRRPFIFDSPMCVSQQCGLSQIHGEGHQPFGSNQPSGSSQPSGSNQPSELDCASEMNVPLVPPSPERVELSEEEEEEAMRPNIPTIRAKTMKPIKNPLPRPTILRPLSWSSDRNSRSTPNIFAQAALSYPSRSHSPVLPQIRASGEYCDPCPPLPPRQPHHPNNPLKAGKECPIPKEKRIGFFRKLMGRMSVDSNDERSHITSAIASLRNEKPHFLTRSTANLSHLAPENAASRSSSSNDLSPSPQEFDSNPESSRVYFNLTGKEPVLGTFSASNRAFGRTVHLPLEVGEKVDIVRVNGTSGVLIGRNQYGRYGYVFAHMLIRCHLHEKDSSENSKGAGS